VIERHIPGAGNLSPAELQGVTQISCHVLDPMGPQIQWVQSDVSGDKVYCVFLAPNEAAIREHAQSAGFPADSIAKVMAVIDPITAELEP
jgi:hypothetical protein